MFPLTLTVLNLDYARGYFHPYSGLFVQRGTSHSTAICLRTPTPNRNIQENHPYITLRRKNSVNVSFGWGGVRNSRVGSLSNLLGGILNPKGEPWSSLAKNTRQPRYQGCSDPVCPERGDGARDAAYAPASDPMPNDGSELQKVQPGSLGGVVLVPWGPNEPLKLGVIYPALSQIPIRVYEP